MSAAITRILGLDRDAGPLELLGLTLAECTAGRIEAALERQLERVDQHPEADTPEADEVRLALHTAAAQLLDPGVRALLIRQAAEAAPAREDVFADAALPVEHEAPRREAVETPRVRPAPAAEDYRPARQAPDEGERALKRLLLGACVFGVLTVVAVVGVLIALTPSRARPVAATPTTPAASTAVGAPVGGSQAPSPGAAQAEPVPAPEPLPPGRAPFKDPGGVIRQLRAAVVKAKSDGPGAVKDLESIVPLIADWWAKYDPAQRRAADDALVEFMYALAGSGAGAGAEEGPRAVRVISSRAALPADDKVVDPDAVWPAAWAAGVLTRLTGERELPTPITAAVRDGLNRAIGLGRTLGSTRFDAGAAAALSLMPTRLITPAESADEAGQAAIVGAFERWVEAVTAGVTDAPASETVLMDGLERVLVDGPEPDVSAAAFGAAELIAARVRWRAEGPARKRLLAWFNDGRISASDLRVVTGAIAGRSSAEGVQPTMVLSIGATADDRSMLRGRYAAAWGLAKPENRGRVLDAWRAAAEAAAVDPKIAPVEAAVSLAVQARLNQAARLIWLGDADAAESLVAGLASTREIVAAAGTSSAGVLPAPPSSPAVSPGPASAPGRAPAGSGAAGREPASAGDGEWAASYLKAEQNIPVRMDRLAALSGFTGQLGRLDAAVLAEAACFASPGQVRFAAQQQAARFVDDPAMVRAMLDMLPSAPRIYSVTTLYQRFARTSLPKQGDAEWELATRRALVERALQMTAVQGEQSVINAASSIVAEAYVSMSVAASAAGNAGGRQGESESERAVRGAAGLYALWRADAERLAPPAGSALTLEQIQRRRDSRDRTAVGPAQAFAARQMAVSELLGYIVAAERPLSAAAVAGVMGELSTSRRESGHVLTQMLATERAITRLWMVRFGMDSGQGGGQ